MNLCIAVDVSKGKSCFQSFKYISEPISKVYQINHTNEGFNELINEIKRIKKEYKLLPIVLFESTGIYHFPLKCFLDENKINYIIISPLLSAKVRKSDIRPVKTDIKDCASIASVFYMKNLTIHKNVENMFEILKGMARYYDYLSDNLKKIKVEFRRLLDIVFPRLDEFFENIYTDYMLNLLCEYSHPYIINNTSNEELIDFLLSKTNHRKSFCIKQINKLKNYCINSKSGCDISSFYVTQIKKMIIFLRIQFDEINTTLLAIINEAKKHPFFEFIKSIPGISDNLSSRILAEIGDISRFSNYKKIIAYAGIDPMIYQSGEKNGEHYSISKKGNKKLRYLLFIAVMSMIKTKVDTEIVDFFFRKRKQGLRNKEALVASMNKLVRLIYSLCKNGERYNKE